MQCWWGPPLRSVPAWFMLLPQQHLSGPGHRCPSSLYTPPHRASCVSPALPPACLPVAPAQRNGLPAPYPSEDAAREAYHFTDLQSFLDLYYNGCNVLRTSEDFYVSRFGQHGRAGPVGRQAGPCLCVALVAMAAQRRRVCTCLCVAIAGVQDLTMAYLLRVASAHTKHVEFFFDPQ